MSDTDAKGIGTANDASVETNDDEDIKQEDPKVGLEAAVEAAQAKVDRQKEHLQGAEDALAEAKRALKEAN